MNKYDFAKMLNGRQYRKEITLEERELARENGLFVVFGASDDLCEFNGSIYDEVDCYDGGTIYLYKKDVLTNECDEEDCPYFEEIKALSQTIEAVWCKKDNDGKIISSWSYETEIPHEKFNILEDDGELYCVGIVFNINDLK